MGKQITHTSMPKRPKAAKIAWSYFCEKFGEPEKLFFDDTTGYWHAEYKSGDELRVLQEEIS